MIKLILTLSLILVFTTNFLIVERQQTLAKSQNAITVLCNSNLRMQIPSSGIPGQYYTYSGLADSDGGFNRITGKSLTSVQPEFPTQLSQKLFGPIVSPDNRLVVFKPTSIDTPLTVWDMMSGEVASLLLTEDEFDNLANEFLPTNRYLKKLVWKDERTLLIQFLDPEFKFIPRIVAIQEMPIVDNPLRITRGEYRTIDYPEFPLQPDHSNPIINLSPLGNYAVQTSFVVVPEAGPSSHVEIFRVSDSQHVFDLPPSRGFSPGGSYTWTQSEEFLFFPVTEYTEADSRVKLVQVEVPNGFVMEANLWEQLDEVFGNRISLDGNFTPTVSPTDDKLAFKIHRTNQNQAYLIIYTFGTGEITAICDHHEITGRTDVIVPIWSPDGEYIGYYEAGRNNHLIFNPQTGDQFSLFSGQGEFAGWVAR